MSEGEVRARVLGAARVWSALRHTAAGGATPHDLDDPVRVDAHDMVPALLQDSVVGAEMAVHGTSAATPFHGILRAAGLEDCRCEVPSSEQQDQQHGPTNSRAQQQDHQGAVRHALSHCPYLDRVRLDSLFLSLCAGGDGASSVEVDVVALCLLLVFLCFLLVFGGLYLDGIGVSPGLQCRRGGAQLCQLCHRR